MADAADVYICYERRVFERVVKVSLGRGGVERGTPNKETNRWSSREGFSMEEGLVANRGT